MYDPVHGAPSDHGKPQSREFALIVKAFINCLLFSFTLSLAFPISFHSLHPFRELSETVGSKFLAL